eukprot:72653-Pelagomonas_calceolata.AAC.1
MALSNGAAFRTLIHNLIQWTGREGNHRICTAGGEMPILMKQAFFGALVCNASPATQHLQHQ